MTDRITESSYGCVPYRKNKEGEFEVCIVLRDKGFWEFPKGKKKLGETDIETALREVFEETGLTPISLKPQTFMYKYNFERNGHTVEKESLLFVGEIERHAPIRIDEEEIVDFAWVSLAEAKERIMYPELQETFDAICKRFFD